MPTLRKPAEISYRIESGWFIANYHGSRQKLSVPNYKRDRTPGGTWFFTVVTHQRRAFLCDAPVRAALNTAIKRVQTKYPFTINAWVLMPDHFHCVWTLPPGDSNYSLRISLLKRAVTLKCKSLVACTTTRSASRIKHREANVWQRRFWEHLIRDTNDLKRHLDYIHYNPVKHGHCQTPTEWPYSTVHKFIATGIYPVGWATPLPTEFQITHRKPVGWATPLPTDVPFKHRDKI